MLDNNYFAFENRNLRSSWQCLNSAIFTIVPVDLVCEITVSNMGVKLVREGHIEFIYNC